MTAQGVTRERMCTRTGTEHGLVHVHSVQKNAYLSLPVLRENYRLITRMPVRTARRTSGRDGKNKAVRWLFPHTLSLCYSHQLHTPHNAGGCIDTQSIKARFGETSLHGVQASNIYLLSAWLLSVNVCRYMMKSRWLRSNKCRRRSFHEC